MGPIPPAFAVIVSHCFQDVIKYFVAEFSCLQVAGSTALPPEGKHTLQLLK